MDSDTDKTDGLSGIFWLFMNWGQWFSSPKKMFLTLVNLIMFGIGLVLVCHFFHLSRHGVQADEIVRNGSLGVLDGYRQQHRGSQFRVLDCFACDEMTGSGRVDKSSAYTYI